MTWILRWESVHPFYRMEAFFKGHKRREILGSNYQRLLGICKNKVMQMYYWDKDLERKAQEAKKIFSNQRRIKQYIAFAEKNARELISLSKKGKKKKEILRRLEILLCTYDLSRPEYVDNAPLVPYHFSVRETVLDQEQKEWNKIKQEYDRGYDVSKKLKQHAQKYGWMGAAEQDTVWDSRYYQKLLKQEVQYKRRKSQLTLIEKLGELRLRLRLAWVESGYWLRGKLAETPTTYAFLLDGNKLTFYSQDQLPEVERMVKLSVKSVSVIKGRTAYPGKVKGRVRIINAWTANQGEAISAMKKGEILVTGMTRPHLIHAISKAAAIITDEGGVASHAAILCREMKKPCVIGTKIATKVLHDGDLIEVDATKGTVRKVS